MERLSQAVCLDQLMYIQGMRANVQFVFNLLLKGMYKNPARGGARLHAL